MTFYEVSNAEVWRELQEVRDRLHTAESAIESLEIAGADREKRVRKLEFRYYGVLGAIVAAQGIAFAVQRAL